ncbi:MAG: sialate O-acetylesterase [Pirellulaceae bacterium]|jgi:alpha-galactosidase|nr:sialate O-acetylesterase [Pirellulaceae bacterium]HJN09846.1 sialate O-acetylesterase [Pirellulaceae bacterium]
MRRTTTILLTGLISLLSFHAVATAAEKPLKVYILAGQSNMQGHAHVRTFDHIGMDTRTAPILKEMRAADGTHRVCDNVWISSLGSAAEQRQGKLTAGFGAAGGGPKIGPEFTFGIYMQKLVDEPILIIKTAWGGKSLHTDFRPPSAGPYEFNEQQLKRLKEQGKDIAAAREDRAKVTGHYYQLMMEHVNKVLKDIKRVYPGYDAKAGYELVGFVWFQGWNDMVDRGVYPNRGNPAGYDQYSEVLAHFIRDVRKDLAAPNMPLVIGVLGVGGPIEKYGPDQQRYKGIHGEFRKAMAAPAAMPEFEGNVTAVLTERYWDLELTELAARWDKVRAKSRSLNQDKSLSGDQRKKALDAFTADTFTAKELKIFRAGTSNAAYHYMGSAKIMAQIGKAFAEAVAETSKTIGE